MTDVLKKWLKQQLESLANVKRCALSQGTAVSDPVRPADMVVHTWTGIQVHIHLIDKPLAVRTLRRIVEGNTRIGVSTLFIVDVKLLPRNGERAPGDRWYVAVHALIHRLYAYQMTSRGCIIGQVQFIPTNRIGEVEARYGAQVRIEQLRCFRHSVHLNAIKGFWMVADFGSDTVKETAGYARRSGTPPGETARTRPQPMPPSPGSHKRPPGSAPTNEPPPARPSAPKTRLEVCYAILGIQRNATREEAKAAFRKLAFELHPDVSDLPKDEAEQRFKLLSEAYEYIKTTRGW